MTLVWKDSGFSAKECVPTCRLSNCRAPFFTHRHAGETILKRQAWMHHQEALCNIQRGWLWILFYNLFQSRVNRHILWWNQCEQCFHKDIKRETGGLLHLNWSRILSSVDIVVNNMLLCCCVYNKCVVDREPDKWLSTVYDNNQMTDNNILYFTLPLPVTKMFRDVQYIQINFYFIYTRFFGNVSILHSTMHIFLHMLLPNHLIIPCNCHHMWATAAERHSIYNDHKRIEECWNWQNWSMNSISRYSQ